MATLTCFHICYDEATRAACPSDFTPLLHDNRMPDLKEIIPIYEYLKGHRWLPDEFIGFFSPRFKQKTGLDFCDVFDAYDRHKESTDAVFFTSYWDAASLYLNPWEQGEFSNPGLLRVSQSFADRLGLNIDLENVVCCLNQTVFSHFIIGNQRFWTEWITLVDQYFSQIDFKDSPFDQTVPYKDGTHLVHPFVVERFASIIAISCGLQTTQHLDHIRGLNSELSSLCLAMDNCKKQFLQTAESKHLDVYWASRIRYMEASKLFTRTAQSYLNRANIESHKTFIRVNGHRSL